MIKLTLILSTLIGHAWAMSSFPTVRELEAGLSAQRGGELPKLIVTSRGVFHVYYMSAAFLGNGRYSVELQLRH